MPWFRKRVSVSSAAEQIAEALAPRSVRRLKETNPLGTTDSERATAPTAEQLQELSLLDGFALVHGMHSVYADDPNDRRFAFGLLVAWGGQLVTLGVFRDPDHYIEQSQGRFAVFEAALAAHAGGQPIENLAKEVMTACGVPQDLSIAVGVTGFFAGSLGASKQFFTSFSRRYRLVGD